jgi:hypothetical protein
MGVILYGFERETKGEWFLRVGDWYGEEGKIRRLVTGKDSGQVQFIY